MVRGRFAWLFWFVSVSASAVAPPPEAELMTGKIRLQTSTIRFGGPQLKLFEGEREWPLRPAIETSEALFRMAEVENVDQAQVTKNLRATRYLLTLEGSVLQTHRLLFDGRDIPFNEAGEFSLDVTISPGNNELTVFLYNRDGSFSNFMVDVQLLDYRRGDEKYFVEPQLNEQNAKRPKGLLAELGTTTGSFDVQNIAYDRLVNPLDTTLLMNADYWLSDSHPYFSYLALNMGGWVHLPLFDGDIQPSIYQFKTGVKARFYLTDDADSLWVYGGLGYYMYHFSIFVPDSDPEQTEITNHGIYALGGIDIPVVSFFGLSGEGSLGFSPFDSSLLMDMGMGIYIRFHERMRARAQVVLRNYSIAVSVEDPALDQKYTALQLSAEVHF